MRYREALLTFHRESKRARYSKKKGRCLPAPEGPVGRVWHSLVRAAAHTVMPDGRFPSVLEFQGDKNRQEAKNKFNEFSMWIPNP